MAKEMTKEELIKFMTGEDIFTKKQININVIDKNDEVWNNKHFVEKVLKMTDDVSVPLLMNQNFWQDEKIFELAYKKFNNLAQLPAFLWEKEEFILNVLHHAECTDATISLIKEKTPVALWSKYSFVFLAIEKLGLENCLIPDDLWKNEVFIYDVLRYTKKFSYKATTMLKEKIPADLWAKDTFVLLAIEKLGIANCPINPKLWQDPDFCIEALKVTEKAYKYFNIDKNLLNDHEFHVRCVATHNFPVTEEDSKDPDVAIARLDKKVYCDLSGNNDLPNWLDSELWENAEFCLKILEYADLKYRGNSSIPSKFPAIHRGNKELVLAMIKHYKAKDIDELIKSFIYYGDENCLFHFSKVDPKLVEEIRADEAEIWAFASGRKKLSELNGRLFLYDFYIEQIKAIVVEKLYKQFGNEENIQEALDKKIASVGKIIDDRCREAKAKKEKEIGDYEV